MLRGNLAAVEYGSITFDVRSIWYGPGNSLIHFVYKGGNCA